MMSNPSPSSLSAQDGATTIFAPATPLARGAIAVVRISGSATQNMLADLSRQPLPPPREMRLRTLYDPQGKPLDSALIVWFSAPHSFTGEDMAELHLHGGMAVVSRVLSVLSAYPSMVAAGAGSFSRRAVLNGRFDVTQAEAMADLIDAESGAQAAQAMRQLGGALGQLYMGWRDSLVSVLAHLEADIEFTDEGLPSDISVRARSIILPLIVEITAHLDDMRGVELRDGLDIAILGAPNVGKSSLVNYLSGRDAAIVSAQAGTTRDIVEVSLVLGDISLRLSDTAGLRDSGHSVEREGVRRALARADVSDIRIFVVAPDILGSGSAVSDHLVSISATDFILVNKADLVVDSLESVSASDLGLSDSDFARAHFVSARDGLGMDIFVDALRDAVCARYGDFEAPVFTRLRHREGLVEARDALVRADENMLSMAELVAEDIRLSIRSLGRITGMVDVEAVLDVVFADFCIGK